MKILIAPLNWGLGHAARCVPVIKKYIADGHEVVIAADGFPMEFLQQEFPSVRKIDFPSYTIHYSAGNTQILAMFRNLPPIISGIRREHKMIRKLQKQEKFDLIISDNRFGLWNHHTKTVYITHQLMIKMPASIKFLEPIAWWLHRQFILKYDECWIPDDAGKKNLSGDLSHKYPLPRNAHFIGKLSRFLENSKPQTIKKKFDVVAVISGIEPQRTIFEHEIIQHYQHSGIPTLIVCGQPSSRPTTYHIGDVTLTSHLNDQNLIDIFFAAKKIVCRSGYSTIMDLATLNLLHKTKFIPTPGQTEQEYLYQLQNAKKAVE
ncbi:MAG: glycosyltransferase family protein [Paludibacter sp.]|nr:glycosyltransferase family protein [Paludibacter sp.]